jgi:hypothetical protein
MPKIIAVSAALLLFVSIGIGLWGLRDPLDAAVLSIFAISALLNSWAG